MSTMAPPELMAANSNDPEDASISVASRWALLLGFALALHSPAGAETLDGRRAVIIDGDTVAFGPERIRIENIDAPESFRSRCERELVVALRAKERLAQLLRSGAVQIDRSGLDPYRRSLARLRTAAGDVGEVLVREGLALPWRDGAEAREARFRHWCG